MLTRNSPHLREEVPWACSSDGAKGSPTSTSAKQATAKDGRPIVNAFRVSPRVPSRYALAFDSGVLLVLTDGHSACMGLTASRHPSDCWA